MFRHSTVAIEILPEDQTRLTPEQWRVGTLKPKVGLTLLEVVHWIMAMRGFSPNDDKINPFQPNQIASSIPTMKELSDFSLDQLEIIVGMVWFNLINSERTSGVLVAKLLNCWFNNLHYKTNFAPIVVCSFPNCSKRRWSKVATFVFVIMIKFACFNTQHTR